MRLIVECEHGSTDPHTVYEFLDWQCEPPSITDPADILAALAEAGVLEVEREGWTPAQLKAHFVDRVPLPEGALTRYVSPWREAQVAEMDSVAAIRAVRKDMAKSFFAGWEEEE